MANIGMMNEGFFVGRKDIIDWINNTLQLNIEKIEQTASGAIACQLLDVMFPGNVPVHKINWAAKQDFEFIANYKILQTVFAKLEINRGVDVNRLIQGRYQDNFEFMQWYKRFFETQTAGGIGDYDAIGQRLKGKGGQPYNDQYGRSGGSAPRPPTGSANASAGSGPTPRNKINKTGLKKMKSSPLKVPTIATTAKPQYEPTNEIDAQALAELQELRGLTDSLKQTKLEMQMEMDRLEKERDFYFEKLRDIEMMLQDLEDNGEGSELTANIFKILYATADGFEAVNPEGSYDAEESAFGTF